MKLNKRQKNQVKKIVSINRELKFSNKYTGALTLDRVGRKIPITKIAQGVTDTSRTGDRIKLAKRIEFTALFDQTQVSVPVTVYRLIFFQWKPQSDCTAPITTIPTIDSILLDTTDVGTVQPAVRRFSHDNRQMFHILYDKTFIMTNDYNGPGGFSGYYVGTQGTRLIRGLIRPKRLNTQVQYVAGSDNNATNHIYCFAMSSSLDTDTVRPSFSMTFKVYYSDS